MAQGTLGTIATNEAANFPKDIGPMIAVLRNYLLNASSPGGGATIPAAVLPSKTFSGQEYHLFVQTVRTTVGAEEGQLPLQAVVVAPQGQGFHVALVLRWRVVTTKDASAAATAARAWTEVPMVAVGGAGRSVFRASVTPLPAAGKDLEWFVTAEWRTSGKKLVFPPEAGEATQPQYATVLVLAPP